MFLQWQQWSHQSNLGWNWSIHIGSRKQAKIKEKQKMKKGKRINLFLLFSQICQWSHQSNLGWNFSIQIVLRKITKIKGKQEWIKFYILFYSQLFQWSQTNLSWNCSIQIVLLNLTKMKGKTKQKQKRWKNKSNILLFFGSHRFVNEVVNPIWVGIAPFRLLKERSLK